MTVSGQEDTPVEPRKAFGYCTACGGDYMLKLDGTVWWHLDKSDPGFAGRTRPACAGAGRPPAEGATP